MSTPKRVVVVAGTDSVDPSVLSTCASHPGVDEAIAVAGIDEALPLRESLVAIIVNATSRDLPVAPEHLLSLAQSGTTVVILGDIQGSPDEDPVLHTVALCQIPAEAPPQVLKRALDMAIARRVPSAAARSDGVDEARPVPVNRPQLSVQEERTLQLYASGLKLVTVARRLGVKPTTAKEYIERVREKYKEAGRPAQSKLDLRLRAIEDGYLEP